MPVFSLKEAAELADVKAPLLRLWLETGKFKTSISVRPNITTIGSPLHLFTEADIPRLVAFVATQGKRKPTKGDLFVDDGKQETFTVAEIASLWHLSPDTIQRLFENEKGVLPLGEKNPRGKRRRVTLRIPRTVMERVKKRRSNA